MKQSEFLKQTLQQKKLRVTKLRMRMLEILRACAKPISAEDILHSLSKDHFKIHKTSIYRQLVVLLREKIITEVQLGDKKRRYELYPDDHHHHVVCMDCGRVEDVPSERDVDEFEKKLAQEKQFKVIHHSLEFFGICAKCNS